MIRSDSNQSSMIHLPCDQTSLAGWLDAPLLQASPCIDRPFAAKTYIIINPDWSCGQADLIGHMQGGGQGIGHSPAAAEWPCLGPLSGGHAAAEPPLPPSPVLACTLVIEWKADTADSNNGEQDQ